ncbi:MAG: nucleoid-associated protein [Pedobacter sp.]|nr:MAG: nucleoid-associated protein [Pedobacter sp.]
MLEFSAGTLDLLTIHHIGNPKLEEGVIVSEKLFELQDENLGSILIPFFLNGFEKTNEVFRLIRETSNGEPNEVLQIVADLFDKKVDFLTASQDLARYFHRLIEDPKHKAGEFYVAYFRQLQVEGESHEAIGLFKSESKETYLKVFPVQGSFDISYEREGINLNKLDKACLIYNTDRSEGFKVAAFESGSRVGSSFWKDDFLKLKIRNDHYAQTQNVLGVYKNFITERLDEEFEISKADKIDLLNKSMKYFKEKDTFDIEEFSNEVIANDTGIAMFKDFKKSYEQEFDMPIADSFEISEAAVKKQARAFKSILKLDKNFHIYIHGNKELIEKGFDQEKEMNYYKVFFKSEE